MKEFDMKKMMIKVFEFIASPKIRTIMKEAVLQDRSPLEAIIPHLLKIFGMDFFNININRILVGGQVKRVLATMEIEPYVRWVSLDPSCMPFLTSSIYRKKSD